MIKRQKIIQKLSKIKSQNKIIVGFGAPAKATTLINFYKLEKYVDYIIDDNSLKKEKYIPNTKIKITDKAKKNNIDYILVFAWNYFAEIKKKHSYLTNKFINIFKP